MENSSVTPPTLAYVCCIEYDFNNVRDVVSHRDDFFVNALVLVVKFVGGHQQILIDLTTFFVFGQERGQFSRILIDHLNRFPESINPAIGQSIQNRIGRHIDAVNNIADRMQNAGRNLGHARLA